MFKIIRMTIVFCLLIGVVFLGAKIYKKSTGMELDLAEKKTQISEKVAELKIGAIKKKLAMEKAYKEAKDALDKGVVDPEKQQQEKNTKNETGPLPAKTGFPEPTVALNPLDEEDRKLTKEVLSEVQSDKETSEEHAQTVEKESGESIFDNTIAKKEPEEPLDLNRLTKIRDFYSKAMEILDFN